MKLITISGTIIWHGSKTNFNQLITNCCIVIFVLFCFVFFISLYNYLLFINVKILKLKNKNSLLCKDKKSKNLSKEQIMQFLSQYKQFLKRYNNSKILKTCSLGGETYISFFKNLHNITETIFNTSVSYFQMMFVSQNTFSN